MINVLRTLLPTRLYVALRTVVMSVVTPVVYAGQHGYFRSAVTRSVSGRGGRSTPWMTFPLVALLESKSFAGRSVLEFGSGSSSAWWGERAAQVVSLETDQQWLERVRAEAPGNVEVVPVRLEHATQTSFTDEVLEAVGDRRFDVVVVDGGDRLKALHLAPDLLTPDGFLIVDDLDLYDDDPAWRAELDAWHARGLGRIDFYGLAIAAPFTRKRCTSIFFGPGSFVTAGRPAA